MALPPTAHPPAMRVLVRARILFRCSRMRGPGPCPTTFTWIGGFHQPSETAEAEHAAAATLAATAIGWSFPETGNVCPRHPKEA